MVSENAVDQLVFQILRKVFDSGDRFSHHLSAQHDVSDQLPRIRIIVFRKC